jgi:oligopeptide/dipeptide ABC transporter ATP-binding protein
MRVLEIENLEIAYRVAGSGSAKAVDGVSLAIAEGEYLGLVGESGCGKSTIAKAILGILPQTAHVTGSIRYRDRELIALKAPEMRRIRWRDIALIPQSAMNGFDPVYDIESQIAEAIAAHEQMPSAARHARAAELFAMVGLPETRLKDYPHQFSGGMRQRAMIAMAFALSPKLIVADEPTTGLDVIVQDQILARIDEIRASERHAMLLITHDMALVSENCDRIAVMYAGRIVEYGGAEVFGVPSHPYTMGLVNAFPSYDPPLEGGSKFLSASEKISRRGHSRAIPLPEPDIAAAPLRRSSTLPQGEGKIRELISIPGTPPSLIDPPFGCRFRERCPFTTERCTQEDPPLAEVAPGHFTACHYAGKAAEFRAAAREPETWRRTAQA